MACIIHSSYNYSVCLLHTASDFVTYSYVTKTQSIDIISLVLAINVDLFEQVFKICYCDQFSAENEPECRYICTSFIESVKKFFSRATKEVKGSPYSPFG